MKLVFAFRSLTISPLKKFNLFWILILFIFTYFSVNKWLYFVSVMDCCLYSWGGGELNVRTGNSTFRKTKRNSNALLIFQYSYWRRSATFILELQSLCQQEANVSYSLRQPSTLKRSLERQFVTDSRELARGSSNFVLLHLSSQAGCQTLCCYCL
jgi:hypothetical protein